MTVRDLPEVVTARADLPGWGFLTDGDVSAVVVAVAPAAEPTDGPEPRAGTVDAALLYHVDLAEMAERQGLTGAAGESTTVGLPRPHRGATDHFPWAELPPRVVLLGLGSGSTRDLRRAGAALARAVAGLDRVACAALAGLGDDAVAAFVEGYLLAAYRRPRRGRTAPDGSSRAATRAASSSGASNSGAGTPGAARTLVLLDPAREPDAAVERARVAADAAWTARELGNEPSDTKSPAWFAERARAIVADAGAAGLATRVLGPRELAAHGLGGLLAVAAGAAREPRLVAVSYTPPAPQDASRHVVVVGGGSTYDTGGLNVVPRTEMVRTTTHAAGAAAALAAVVGAARRGLGLRVTAVLALVENGFGAAAVRAGDVVTLASGRTVEVTRPGEGARVVLADALSYAATLEPDVLLDVATLTNAATTALGPGRAALFATDDALAARVELAAAATGEDTWRLPLAAEYAGSLASPLADLRDVPADSPGAGAVTAALFLREAFAPRASGVAWAHLDVTGHAWAASASGEVPDGATGFGARLLLEVLTGLAGTGLAGTGPATAGSAGA